MPSPVLTDLEREVGEATTVMASAATLISGIQARIDAAVQTALANGATEGELAPFVALSQELSDGSDALSAAVQANTPTP